MTSHKKFLKISFIQRDRKPKTENDSQRGSKNEQGGEERENTQMQKQWNYTVLIILRLNFSWHQGMPFLVFVLLCQ
jgi:hypothetical protein